MKIKELSENLVTMNLNRTFKDDTDLKNQIIAMTDLVCNVYKKNGLKNFGLTAFSNVVADKLKSVILEEMVKKYKIHSQNELADLKDAIDQTIKLAYLEYKVNGIMY